MTFSGTKPFLIVVGLVMLAANDAQAYLDPGSASIIFQALVASVLGGLVVLRVYWSRLKMFFRRDKQSEAETDVDEQSGVVTDLDDRH